MNVALHDAGDRLAAIGSDRHMNTHRVRPRGDVELPADPHQRVTKPHQKTIAQIVLGGGIGRSAAVEPVQDDLVAAIEDVDERRAVAGRRFRTEDVQIRRELDQARRVHRRLVEIGDDPVARSLRIDREVNGADDLLVAGQADVGACRDLDARHLGARRRRRRRRATRPRRSSDDTSWRPPFSERYCALRLPTNWLNAASHLAMVCSGPVSLRK